jgi:hypothetical protein
MIKENEPTSSNKIVRGMVIGTVGVLSTVFLVNTWNDGYDLLRKEEQRSREFSVEAAANQYIDVIQVTETGKEERNVTATLLYGDEALRACNIEYDIHPDSNSTFDPETLDISGCFDD